MSVNDIKAWQEVGDKLAEEVEDEEVAQEPRPDLLEKQPQTNIPAKGLINRPTETTSVTLEGSRTNAQRKLVEVKKNK